MDAGSVRAWKIDQVLPIVPQLSAVLRDAIIRGDLAPGQRISESEIATLCHVSRQPVREAFIHLSTEGLLEIRPQRGTIVSKIDFVTVLDARFLREAIEADIVSTLASNADPKLVQELRAQIKAQYAAVDASEFMRLDEDFHHTLADAADKRGAWKLIQGLKSQMDRVRFLSLDNFQVRHLIAQHERVVDCIFESDQQGANRAIRTHLRAILADLPNVIAEYPESFHQPEGDLPFSLNAPIQPEGEQL
jgi:DNA-binding GntR family transcriptional regulator